MNRFKFPALAVGTLLIVALTLSACSDNASIVGPDNASEYARTPSSKLVSGPVTDTAPGNTCPDGVDGWTKIDAVSGAGSGGFGSFDYSGNTLNYDINAGWTLEFCIKYATSTDTWAITGAEAGSLTTGTQQAISHVSWRITDFQIAEDLDVIKTAAGTYQRDITWDLDKKVRLAGSGDAGLTDLLELSGAPGESFNVEWFVDVTKNIGDPYGYDVSGTIDILNPNTFSVNFTIADVLDDGTVAVVNCPSYTVPAASGSPLVPGQVQCSYSASPTDAAATENEVTVTPEHADLEPVQAFADVLWSAVYNGFAEGELTDDRFPEYEETFAASGTEVFPETFTCSEDVDDYGDDGVCVKTYENTATLTFEDDSYLEASAAVELTCLGLYGCTPGFWRQEFNYVHWVDYAPNDLLQAVFEAGKIVNGLKDNTLAEALEFDGGSGAAGAQRILFRAAVASLLNLSHPDIAFIVPASNGDAAITSAADLITAVNSVLSTQNSGRAAMLALAERLDAANNAVNLCPLAAGRSLN
jgi:hypothetical protein